MKNKRVGKNIFKIGLTTNALTCTARPHFVSLCTHSRKELDIDRKYQIYKELTSKWHTNKTIYSMSTMYLTIQFICNENILKDFY